MCTRSWSRPPRQVAFGPSWSARVCLLATESRTTASSAALPFYSAVDIFPRVPVPDSGGRMSHGTRPAILDGRVGMIARSSFPPEFMPSHSQMFSFLGGELMLSSGVVRPIAKSFSFGALLHVAHGNRRGSSRVESARPVRELDGVGRTTALLSHHISTQPATVSYITRGGRFGDSSLSRRRPSWGSPPTSLSRPMMFFLRGILKAQPTRDIPYWGTRGT